MKSILIGSNGTIGRSLLTQRPFDQVYNSDNIEQMRGGRFHLVIIAAPSGNRLAINRGYGSDEQDIEQISQVIDSCEIDQLILISSIDVITNPNSRYSQNRKTLENKIKKYPNSKILRLATLVGESIKKNVLYDLAHGLWLDKIAGDAVLQWSLLDDLANQIDIALLNQVQEINVVSEPIVNHDIVQSFFPHISLYPNTTDITYDVRPYVYCRRQIFQAIENYIK